MKTCPSCRRSYADNALPFCPQDGTQLVSNFPAYNPQPPMANVAPPQMSNAPPYNQAYNQAYNQPAYVQSPTQAPRMLRHSPHNPMRKWVKISKTSLIVSIVLLIVALVMGLGSHWSNPLSVLLATVGGMGLISGIIGLFSYGKQAATIDEMFKQAGSPEAMLAGGNLLAHWTYSPQEWSQFVQSEIARNRSANLLVLCILGLVFLFILIFLSAKGGAESLLMGLIFFAVVGSFSWWFATAEMRNLKAQSSGEAFISKTGLLLNDRYYPWNVMGMSLTGVFYEQGNPNVVLFKYEQLGAYGAGGAFNVSSNERSVRVPVPVGREVEAQNLAARFF